MVGTAGVSRMPGAIPCALVAMAILFAAILPHNPGFPARVPLMAVISVVFLARGIAAYIPAWRRLTPEAAFTRNDQRLFGPLCVALGIGYLILTIGEI